jgi:membrane-bound lytic murein transglycosylase D
MNRFKPLALSLSLLFAAAPSVQAGTNVSALATGVNEGLAAGLDMMLQNSSLLRTGDNVWERVRQGFQMGEVNPELVRRQERYYGAHPELVKRTLNRSRPYMFYIAGEVERRGMPTEIAMLPMVESSFVPTASSPVGAAGLWQFMPQTGRQYGLEQTWWYDGRRDVVAATNAALDYLQNLYTQFGDWSLALAAYNWGEGNLARSIARTQAAGLEPTYENIRMPAETRNYVPKLLAVRNMLADPTTFGLRLDKLPNKPYFVSVSVARHMDISLAAKFAGISVKEFMELNPAFNLPVYAYKSGRQMLLPANRADRFETNLAKWEKPLLTWQVYTPTSNELAADVADRSGMSSTQLMAVNHLNNPRLSIGRPLLIAMKNGEGDLRELNATDTPVPLATMVADAGSSTLAQPEVLSKPVPISSPRPLIVAQAAQAAPIATKAPAQAVSTKPAAAVAASAVATVVPITPSAPLQLAAVDTPPVELSTPPVVMVRNSAPVRLAMAEQAVPQMAQAAASQHTVATGDTLYNIAHRYNLSVVDLKALNGISGTKLRIGQTLQLRARQMAQAQQVSAVTSAVPTDYVVQRGDTVFSIARHFGIDHTDIQRLNDTRKLSRLQPGQVVKIQGL